MAWTKLDDAVFGHPKFLAAGAEGVTMWMMALAYSNRYSTDGFVPDLVVPTLYPVRQPLKVASKLVEARLFERVSGGYLVHDYLDYNRSAQEVEQQRAVEREKKARQRATCNDGPRAEDGRYLSRRDNGGESPRDNLGDSPGDSRGVSRHVSSVSRPVPSRPINTHSSSSDLQPRRQPVDDENEDAFGQACQMLAQRALVKREAERGEVGDARAWLAKAHNERVVRHGDEAERLLDASPKMPAVALADALEPPAKAKRAKSTEPMDSTAAAQRARTERAEARARGELCPVCEGVGMVLGEDDDAAVQCRSCGPSRLSVVGD